MRKKIGAIILFSFCLALTGCGGTEKSSEIQKETQEMLEESKEEVVVSETENTKPEGKDIEDFEEEKTEDEDWEAEMYDPVKSGEDEDWEEEMYDPVEYDEEIKEVAYKTEDYGVIEEYGSEFYYEEDVMGYYYNIEQFFLNSDFLYTMNDTLEQFYDKYLDEYQKYENWYMEEKQELPPGKVPSSELRFSGIEYVDNDYISLLFLEIDDVGGIKPYHFYDAITLDRHTGKEVTAEEILNEDKEVLLETVNELMGLDAAADWSEIDFYLREGKIVFFYRMPGIWEDVVLGR